MAIAPEDDQVSGDPDLTLPDDSALPEPAAAPMPKQTKNYETTTDLTSALTDEAVKKFEGVMVPVLPDTMERVNEDLAAVREEIDPNDQSISWYQSLLSAFQSHPSNGMFEDALADPNASWRNVLSHGGQNINVGRPRFSNKGRGSSRMSSERLQLSVRAQLGLGAPVQVPLMASGFYATVKPLGEDEIIALWREIIAATVKLGRVTHGLIFSNNQVFTAKAICDAWVRSLVQTTVSDLPPENLFDHTTINDLPLIAHSLATSIYPNGFPMTRAVFMEDAKGPKEEINQLIDLRKCLFMNGKMFKEEQLAHMVKRIESPMTLKMIKEYREQFVFNTNAVISISDTIKLHLKTPSLREYFESGERWINEITATVHQALGADAEEAKRLQYISQLAKATRLRQYSHYVSAIEEDGELHNSRDNVDKVLSSLSGSDAISKIIYSAISNYINSSQVAIVATTSVNQYEDEISGTKWPRLIPLDAVSVFFQLVEQKLRGITSRALEDTSD